MHVVNIATDKKYYIIINSTAPLSDKELSVWDLLRSGHELGQGEPPDSWAEKQGKIKLYLII